LIDALSVAPVVRLVTVTVPLLGSAVNGINCRVVNAPTPSAEIVGKVVFTFATSVKLTEIWSSGDQLNPDIVTAVPWTPPPRR
jgi:hypothetical protein